MMIRMSNDAEGIMECNDKLREPQPLDPQRTWETFLVVSAGKDHVALYNECHKRFLRMNGKDGSRPDGASGSLKDDCRWQIKDLGKGKVSVYSPSCQRFLRVESDGKVNGLGGVVKSGSLPDNWCLEKFIVVPVVAAPVTACLGLRSSAPPWEGFGCSLSWMGKALGSAKEQNIWADLLFTTDTLDFSKLCKNEKRTVPCLGLSIVRYNVGGVGNQEDPEKKSSACEHWFRIIEGFVPKQPGTWNFDWSRDMEQRVFLDLALQRGVSTVELFFNSPMWWMTDSKSSFGGCLEVKEQKAFAWYIASVCKQFRNVWKVPVRSVSPFNEPSAGWWKFPKDQEGCNIPRKQQKDIINDLKDKLVECGLHDKVLIAASEENFIDHALESSDYFRKEGLQVKDGKIGRCNMHSYAGWDPLSESNPKHRGKRTMLHNLIALDGLNIWMSEYGTNNSDATGNSDGMSLAQTILEDLSYLKPTAWCYWQPVGHANSKWALVKANFGEVPKVGKIPEMQATGFPLPNYFILAHFSRFIRPGAFMMDCTEPWAVAFTSTGSLVVVLLNNDHQRTMKLKLPKTFKDFKVKTAVITQPVARRFFVDWTCQCVHRGESCELNVKMENKAVCSVLLEL